MNEQFPPQSHHESEPQVLPAGELLPVDPAATVLEQAMHGPTIEAAQQVRDVDDIGHIAAHSEVTVAAVPQEAEDTASKERASTISKGFSVIWNVLRDNDVPRPDHVANERLHSLDIQFGTGVFETEPDLKLAAKSALLGSMPDERSVTEYFGARIMPLMESAGAMHDKARALVINVVNSHGNMMRATANDPNGRMAYRQSIGGEGGPLRQTIESISAMDIDEATKKNLRIVLTGLSAGVAPQQSQQRRVEALQKLVL